MPAQAVHSDCNLHSGRAAAQHEPCLPPQGFLEKFFPEVQAQHVQTERDRAAGITRGPDSNPYCQYDNQALQWFTSCLFVAGVVAAIPAGWCTR